MRPMMISPLEEGARHRQVRGEDGRLQGDPPFWANRRFAIAGAVVLALVMSACLVVVNPGEAVVITRFGNPVRVLTHSGLALKFPAPIENKVVVDLRLRTTSSGLHDVGTRDGLRVLVQAYIAWQVPNDPEHILQFLRAVRNQPAIAAAQLRSFTGSGLEVTASSFDLASLLNTDPSQVRLGQFETSLRRRIADQALRTYGVQVREAGVERLTLPAQTLSATIERMKAERDTVAAERAAEGERAAAEIQSNANRDSRILIAKANADAADIEAKSRITAAGIYKQAYSGDPRLYTLLRSLDSLAAVVGPNTRLILRTDAAPFRVLVDGPNAAAPGASASRPGR